MADSNYSIQIRIESAAAQAGLRRLERELRNVDRNAHVYRNTLQNTQRQLNSLSGSTNQNVRANASLKTILQQIANNTRSIDNNFRFLNSRIVAMTNNADALTATLTSSSQAMQRLGNTANNVTVNVNNATGGMNRMARAMITTRGIAITLRDTFATFGTALTLNYAWETVRDFEQQLAAVRAVSGATKEQFASLREEAQRLGQTTIYTAGQAAEGMRAMAQAGFSTNEILTASKDILALAQVGQMDLGAASEIAARALRGFHIEAEDMSRVADVMAKTATRSTTDIQGLGYAFKYVSGFASSMGISIEEASAAIGVLANAGIDASLAGTGLRGTISKLMNQSKHGKKILQSFGLTMEDLNVRTHGFMKALENLKNSGITGDQIISSFGLRAGPAAITLIENLEHVKSLLMELESSQGQVAETQRVMDDNIAASWKKVTSAIEAFVTKTSDATGATKSLQNTFDSLAAGIRWVTDNNYVLIPVLGMLTGLFIKGVTATRAYQAASAAASSGLTRLQGAMNATTVSARAMNTAMVAGSMAARGLAGVFALFGGIPGILAMIGTLIYSNITNKLEESVEQTQLLGIAMQNLGNRGQDLAQTMDVIKEKIKTMSKPQLNFELDDNTRKFEKMKVAIENVVSSFRALSSVGHDPWGYDLATALNESSMAGANLKRELQDLTRRYVEGKIKGDDYTGAIYNIITKMRDSQPEVVNLGMKLIQLAKQMEVTKGITDELSAAIENFKDVVEQAEIDVEAQNITNAIQGIYKGLQNELFLADQAKAVGNVFKGLGGLFGEPLENVVELNKETGKWVSLMKTTNNGEIKPYIDPGSMELLNEAIKKEEQVLKLREERKKKERASRSTRSTSRSDTTIQNARKQIEKLKNEINELNNVSDKNTSKLNEKMTEIQNIGQKAKISASEIKTLQQSYSEAFKANTLREFNQELVNLYGATDKVQQLKFNETLRMWESRLKGIGLTAQEVTYYMNQLKDALDVQKFKESYAELGMLAQVFGANVENSAQYQKMLSMDTAAMITNLKNLGVEINNNTTAWVQLLVKSREANGLLWGVTTGLIDKLKEASDWASVMNNVVTTTIDRTADVFTEFIINGKADFAEFAESLVKDIMKIIAKMLVLRTIMGLIGMGMGAMGSSVTPTQMGGFFGISMAKGGVLKGNSLADYSNTIVTKPTPFTYASANKNYAKGAGLMGEAGWEAIMPLKRTSDGRLGVQATNSGMGQPIVNVNVINETGQSVSTTGQARANSTGGFDLDIIISQVDQALTSKAKHGQSQLMMYQEKAYGMNRASVITRTRGRV